MTKHFCPGNRGGCTNGMQSVFAAPPSDSPCVRFLTSSSLSFVSHHGVSTIFLSSSASTNPSQEVTVTTLSLRRFVARASMSACISSHIALARFGRSTSITVSLAPVSRRTTTQWPASMSRGPNSTRRGTPLSSQWLYFQPGV